MNNLVCGKFMNILSNSVIGVCIGLVVALVLTLVLHFTCFRERNMALLYVAMFLVFALCGGLVHYKFFKHDEIDGMPTSQEQTQTTIDTIKEKWTNTNGFFTPEQISKVQEDDSAPTADDQIIPLDCYDFGSYIVFSYKSGEVYQNALFYKSPNGLIVDGMINMWAKIESRYKFPWWRYDVSTFKWNDMRNSAPYFFSKSDIVRERYNNLVSLSSKSASFLYNHGIFVGGYNEACSYAMKQAAVLTGDNTATNFIKFGNVELIGSANTGYTKINSFYNYLYEQIKGTTYGSTKLIDANSALCLPIPQSEQEKYPISESKKSEYGDKEFYGVYKSNIAVELKYLKGSKTLAETDKNKEFFEDLDNDNRYKDKVQVEKVESTATYSKLSISFKDTGNSDLTNLNLLTSPVTITFTNIETNAIKKIVVDTLSKLKNGVNLLLDKGMSYRYEVRGNGLVFESHDGTFKVTADSNSLVFNYYYVDNSILIFVGLNPIGTIDTSEFDLSTDPVKIVVKNSKNRYMFTFDDNSKLNEKQSQLVELGEYEYAILSDSLVFANNSGKLTVTTVDNEFMFNYVFFGDYIPELNLSFVEKPLNGGISDIQLESNPTLGYYLIDKFGGVGKPTRELLIYDSNNSIVSKFSLGYACNRNLSGVIDWLFFYFDSDPTSSDITFSGLTLGEGLYKAQVVFTSSDSTTKLCSTITTFEVNSDDVGILKLKFSLTMN